MVAEGKPQAQAAAAAREFAIWITLVNVALYATCYQLQRPVEPFLIDQLTKTSQTNSLDEYAKLQSFFSALQMVGSVIVGWFLDRLGARTMFLVTFVASALSYYLLSQATTFDILYYSKLPTIFQAGFLCAQTLMAQITTNKTHRVVAMGRLTVAYSVGTVIGPALGGFLGKKGDYYFGATHACYGSLLSCALSLLLPASSSYLAKADLAESEAADADAAAAASAAAAATASEDASFSSSASSPSTSSLDKLRAVFLSVGGLLGTKVVSSVANSMRETTQALVLKGTFSMREQQLGLTMSFLSGVNALVNGFLLGPVSRYFGGDLLSVIYRCVAALSVLCLAQAALAPAASTVAGQGTPASLYCYLATTFGMTICAYVLSTNATSESTSRVPASLRGTLLGVEHSLFAFARIGAPAASVALLKAHGVAGVAGVAAAVFASILGAWHSSVGQAFGTAALAGSGVGAIKEGRSLSEERKEK